MNTLQQLTQQIHRPDLTSRQLGSVGEAYACAWLECRGWTIVDRNWQSRYGELDIVALSPALQLTFVEVKTRRTAHFGPPQEAVTAHKRMTIRRAAAQWLMEYGRHVRHRGTRFDVIALSVDGDARAPRITHIPGALQ
ncbi:YraN family protein [Bifidobacterium simiarum]|uniref:YraN family protein n=1 Tax=Bifidobacterium simiarum TaxID=2045441 RepID=UPI001BDDBA92|nr:YraN family protein [Bifidobacterium simiarum]MBT1167287.1 YraN family protein [Bifidobacterium simiarum]